MLFGCTSHERICITDGECTDDQWYLIINSTGYDESYNLQFLLPTEIIGWSDAWVHVTIKGKEELYFKIIDVLRLKFN